MEHFDIISLANNDNEVLEVNRNQNEYELRIKYWDDSLKIIRTVNCRMIMHNPELISEIGDIDKIDDTYYFKSVCSDEVFLKISADDFCLIRQEKSDLDNEERAELLIQRFGFEFANIPKDEIIYLIEDEIENYQEGSAEYIRLLCGYLFCLGDAVDADLIEKAKYHINFDVECMIDGEWIDNLRDNDATGEREDIIRSFVEYYKGCTKDFR